MTPELMEEGARRREAMARREAEAKARSGDRSAAYGRVLRAGVPDFAHGVALYVEDLCVSFDGFKALNRLSLVVNVG